MSKIHIAIHEIQCMNELAVRDQWVNRIHPLVKLMVTLFYIIAVVSFSKYQVMDLLGMILYPIAIFILNDLSPRNALRRMRIVLPLVCLIGLVNPFFDRQVLVFIGSIPITGGMVSMVTLMLKGIFCVLASYLLIATTTMEQLCYALRFIHIPQILVTQFLLTYRYITVLLEEAGRITQAYALRAPKQKGIHYKAWGTLAGQLLLRSIDRAGRVYESMCLRGYHGEFAAAEKQKNYAGDLIYLAFWLCFTAIFRFVPVIVWVGRVVT